MNNVGALEICPTDEAGVSKSIRHLFDHVLDVIMYALYVTP
jgi:hypothetical protein